MTQKNARRESTATAYLKPIRSRKNLTVLTHALGRKIIVRDGRVTGLDMLINDKPEHVKVDRELISSGGAVNSPRLLLLLGIGPRMSCASLASRSFMTCPAWARTSKIIWTST